MRNLYEGGQCNPNSIGATSNHYKRLMNNLAIGKQNPQKITDFTQRGVSYEQQIANREAMIRQMNHNFNMSQNQINSEQRALQQMMNQQFQGAQMEHQARIMQMQQMEWVKAQEEIIIRQNIMQKQFEAMRLAEEAKTWQNQITMQNTHKKAQISYQQEQKNILKSSESMLDVMMNDPDPRFQNSQFLHFLKRVQNGDLVIEGKEIRQVKPDQKLMQNAWNQAEKTYQANQVNMEGTFLTAKEKEEAQRMKVESMMQKNWASKLDDYEKEMHDSQNFQKMLEAKYMEVLKQMNLDLSEAWQSSTDLEEQLVHGQIKQQYQFNSSNPYVNAEFPKEIAWNMINTGKNNEAILCLEAHLQKNMEDSETWRVLGRILQQNDQDQKSIPCFMNSLKFNPKNLDSLLSLGVSCTNILDQVKAMNYLKQWIIFNPKYEGLNIDPNIIPDNNVDMYSYKIEDIKTMNANMINVFEKAIQFNPNDPQLLTATAILYFVKREYEVSIDLFRKALTLDPTNYLLMNKLGASLAHLGRSEEAIHFYHRALDIRPNYVRVWVNIGIAHAFKGMYDEAVRFYLNALSFRPDAKHVWSYLHTCFMSMQRYDLISLISTQNPKAFQQFQVIDLNQLPHPQIEYRLTTEKHILNKQAKYWLETNEKKQ